MLKYLLGCACAVAMTHAARAEECVSLDTFLPMAKAEAAKVPGSGVMVASVEAATKILYYINSHGDPTSYKGDQLVITVEGTMSTGVVLIMPFVKGCENAKDGFSVSPVLFLAALKYANEPKPPSI